MSIPSQKISENVKSQWEVWKLGNIKKKSNPNNFSSKTFTVLCVQPGMSQAIVEAVENVWQKMSVSFPDRGSQNLNGQCKENNPWNSQFKTYGIKWTRGLWLRCRHPLAHLGSHLLLSLGFFSKSRFLLVNFLIPSEFLATEQQKCFI